METFELATDPQLLTINVGSSSLKAAIYRTEGQREKPQRISALSISRIGQTESQIGVTDEGGVTSERVSAQPTSRAALQTLLDWLRSTGAGARLSAIGHRMVAGGLRFQEPQRVTPEVAAALRSLIPLAPDHLPAAIEALDTLTRAFPTLPQVVCFDTAFHYTMPPTAQRYALPQIPELAEVRRYGFHGLSYESIMRQLSALDSRAAAGRVIIAHLGAGASMVAVREGRSVDTTMGFTPTGGLMMATRSGDLDPGVLLYLLQQQGMGAEALARLVAKEAGLLGVSGRSGDMQELLAREAMDSRATEAIALFCYQARKFLGALTTTLGGIETLVFTGGIGEHAAPIRARICAGLAYLGITLDEARNRASAPIISPDGAAVTVRVIATDEDLMIARHTLRLLAQGKHD